MKRISCLLCIAFILHPLLANADSCRRITSTINHDLTRNASNLKNKNFDWMNLVWLQQQLGTADEKNIVNGKTKYHWRCKPDGSYLVAVVDIAGNIVRVSGEYNSDEGSGMFAAHLPNKDVSPEIIKTDPPKPQIKLSATTIIPAATANAELNGKLTEYNEHYKTSFQTETELQNDILQRIKNYYSSLRVCQQGTYEYAIPIMQHFLYQTSSITAKSEGRCQVKTSYVISQVGNIDLKCNYQPQSLALYTDSEAETAARGGSQFDSEHPTPLQTAVEKECKRYVDGVP